MYTCNECNKPIILNDADRLRLKKGIEPTLCRECFEKVANRELRRDNQGYQDDLRQLF